MKSLTVLAASTALFLVVGCGKKAEPAVQEPTSTASPFIPNGSGQVTSTQIKFWSKVNNSLDSLASANAETMQTKDTSAYHTAYLSYTTERETLCKSNGLSGGFKEYEWISKNISKAVNRPLLDSLKLHTL